MQSRPVPPSSPRVPRPNTLNVELGGYDGPPIRAKTSGGSGSSSGSGGSGGAAVSRNLQFRSPGAAAPLTARGASPSGLSGFNSAPAATSSFSDELNRLLLDDQQQLAAGSSTSRGGPTLQNGRKPLVGRRQAALASPVPPSPSSAVSALPSIRGAQSVATTPRAASVSQTQRGPRPRTSVGTSSAGSSGAFTARAAAKEAAAAATMAAAAAALPARPDSSEEDDSDESDSDESVNAVSSNAAAALYAGAAASPSPTDSAGEAPAPGDDAYGRDVVAGGGIVGERDPAVKWASVDAFALATPKQRTGSVLALAGYLARGPATPGAADKARAIFRWICEFITWVPPVAGLAGATAQAASSPTAHRARGGLSEAATQAQEAAKAAAESKMEADARMRQAAARGALDDDDDEEDGSSAARPQIDVLTDPLEILRRRRASTQGLCVLFQSLCESAGLECLLVEGYGKGCGLVRVAERFDAPNHWWAAVRLDSSWGLVDLAWSASYINQGKVDRTFTNVYFRASPTVFALQHFPTRVHSGRRAAGTTGAIAKQITEFVKMPEKMQLLDAGASAAAGGASKCITKTQFEDAMMIERGYLDLGILMAHPVGVHTVRHDTPLYTISLASPTTLEFTVEMNLPTRGAGAGGPARFIDQCWHVTYAPAPEDPSSQKVEVQFVFPTKGTYTCTVRARRLASKLLTYEDVVHFRFLCSCGLYDIRKERDVFAGFLARPAARVVGAEHEFEHKFAVLRPLRGHFELNQPARLQLAAPAAVTRMVAVNNGRWIELLAAPSGAASGPLKNRQIFEGDLKLMRYPDIQIHYKTKGQAFHLIYQYGVTEGGGGGGLGGDATPRPLLTDGGDAPENKHGKVVLDSRGTCFEKRLHITALKVGKRSCSVAFETRAATQVKAEVRAGWTSSAQKGAERVTVAQTGTRAASTAGERTCTCAAQPCPHTPAAAPQYDVSTWEVTAQLTEPGDYSLHLFLSSAGSGVFRFALVLYLRMDERKNGFNLDI